MSKNISLFLNQLNSDYRIVLDSLPYRVGTDMPEAGPYDDILRTVTVRLLQHDVAGKV